jgi:transcriptional regulator with XRE-family HTH domain
MAAQLRMSVGNYSNIENGKTDITFNRLQEIAKVLEVDYQQILNLAPTQIFNNNSPYTYSGGYQNNYTNDELIKQLQTKDEQIQKLTALLEKALNR